MPYGQRVLKLESPQLKGEDVRQLQIKIVAFGSTGKPVACDGVFGGDTEAAVKKFQKYFGLEENGTVDNTVFEALDTWGQDRKSVMESILGSGKYPCNHATIPNEGDPSDKDECDRLWNDHVKGKIKVGEGDDLAGDPACSGFGSGLQKIASTNSGTYIYKSTVNQVEHDGIDKILFWLIMGIMKIYGVDDLVVTNGYRCNYKYFYIRKKYKGGISNHTGHALDFRVPGTDITRPGGGTLASEATERKKHCNQVRDDLKTFGFAETFKTNPKNRPRTEPRAYAKTWVHIDTTVYKKHFYVKTVDEALAPRAVGALALPVDLSGSLAPSRETLDAYYAHTEIKHAGGYYPIGANTVWHGGVHLHQKAGAMVVAPLPGTIVAARLPHGEAAALGQYGSRNFILLQHDLHGKQFYSLYMHLNNEALTTGNENLQDVGWLVSKVPKYKILIESLNYRSEPVVKNDTLKGQLNKDELVTIVDKSKFPWVQVKREGEDEAVWIKYKEGWQKEIVATETDSELVDKLSEGKIVNVGKAVSAGQNLWTVGEYGSPDYRTGLLHWEIFSAENLFPEWPAVEDPDSDCTLDSARILEMVEQDPSWYASDSVLTHEEVKTFYRSNNQASRLRRYACKFISEWGFDVDKALENMEGRWITFHLKDHITPYLWWDEAKDANVPLPESRQVWHYNPIRFIEGLLNGEMAGDDDDDAGS